MKQAFLTREAGGISPISGILKHTSGSVTPNSEFANEESFARRKRVRFL
jgi:hypothetical protein